MRPALPTYFILQNQYTNGKSEVVTAVYEMFSFVLPHYKCLGAVWYSTDVISTQPGPRFKP